MTEKQTTDDATVKDQLEYYAKKGLNPYVFGKVLNSWLDKNEQLKTLFGEGEPLRKELMRVVDVAIVDTFEHQDDIAKQDTIKALKRSFKHSKDSYKSKKKKGMITKENENQKTGWTIYSTSPDETKGEHKRKWQFVHFFFKYKIAYPAIWLLRKFVGKKLRMPILNTPYNENIMLFDAAFEDAIRDWNLLYLKGLPNPLTAGKSDEWWEEHIRTAGVNENLRMVKDSFVAVALTDTAYREFLNLLIHRIAMHAGQHYKRVQEAGNGTVRHLFFSSGFAEDIHYYHYYRLLRDRTKTKMVETGYVTISDHQTKEDNGETRELSEEELQGNNL